MRKFFVRYFCFIDMLLFFFYETCFFKFYQDRKFDGEKFQNVLQEEMRETQRGCVDMEFMQLLIIILLYISRIFLFIFSIHASSWKGNAAVQFCFEQSLKETVLSWARDSFLILYYFLSWTIVCVLIFIAYGALLPLQSVRSDSSKSAFPTLYSPFFFSYFSLLFTKPSASPFLRTTLFATSLASSLSLLSFFSSPTSSFHQLHHPLFLSIPPNPQFRPKTACKNEATNPERMQQTDRETEFVLFKHKQFMSLGALLGALVGAIPIPLDWNCSWQVWPIPNLYSSTFFSLLFGILALSSSGHI